MKKYCLFLILTLCLAGQAAAYDFSRPNADGVTLYYNMISVDEVEVTCEFQATATGPVFPSYGGHVRIPDTVTYQGFTYGVRRIGDYAFAECAALTSVSIPQSVRTIGLQAFKGCTRLSSVIIPSSVWTVSDEAFKDCTALSSLSLPSNLSILGFSVFKNTAWYDNPGNWAAGVLYANTVLVAADTSLAGSYVPNSGTTCIACGAFRDCGRLTAITLPSTVTAIGEGTFAYCSALASVSIPGTVTDIDPYAFLGCSALTSVTVPPAVSTIESYTFSGCSALTAVTLPPSVTAIADQAFSNCSALTAITLPPALARIDAQAFSGCAALAAIVLPSSVIHLGAAAFSGCRALVAVQLPAHLATVQHNAFFDCVALTSLELPVSVSAIESYAFGNCSALAAIHARALTPPAVSSTAFQGVDSAAALYVPCNRAEAYLQSSHWSAFQHVYEDCVYISALSDNSSMGTVSGGGAYAQDEAVTLRASPRSGYQFLSWTDGDSENPRHIVAASNATYVATFDRVGIAEADTAAGCRLFPNPTEGKVTLGSAAALVEAYDQTGRRVAGWQHVQQVDLSSLPAGLYTLRILSADGTAVRKVVKR